MKNFSRLSVTLGAVLALTAFQVQAQAGGTTGASGGTTGGSTGSSTPYGSSPSSATTGTTSPSTTDSYGSSMQNLPTEPTAAGYGSGSGYETRDSWLPYTTAGYIGLSVGSGTLEDSGCVTGQTCDDFDGALSVVTGGMFTPYLGMQLGYFRLGDATRNGGKVKVSGVNLSLTGVAPLGTNFSLVGRVGGTYGWTDTSVGTGVATASGEENTFAPAYGVGVSWDFNRNWSATVDWDRHHLRYAGDEKRNTDIATIGFKYRF